MDKLISTDLNGFPFVLDDLRFIDNGVRDAFKGSFDALRNGETNDGWLFDKNPPSEINPAFIGSSSPVFPETYCYINGEIYKIPATALNFTGRVQDDAYCIEPDFSFDSAGTKVFEDTTPHETYQIRKAKLVLKLAGTWTYGTDISVLYFDASLNRFSYDVGNSYFHRIADKLRVVDIDFVMSLMENQITNLQSSVNDAWTTINPTLIAPRLYLNGSPATADYLSDYAYSFSPYNHTIDTTKSYLKFKKIGKTLHVDFSFVSLKLPNNDVWSNIKRINFDLNGIVPSLTSLKDFKSIATGNEMNTSTISCLALSGNKIEVFNHKLKPKFFSIILQNAIYNTDIESEVGSSPFNTGYNFNNMPPTPVLYSGTGGIFSWNIKGQFTCEIN